MSRRYDIGSNHWVRLATGHGEPDNRVVSLIIDHLSPSGQPCTGSLTLRQSDPRYHVSGGKPIALWNVLQPAGRPWMADEGIEGVTLDPSVLCHCGDHGWIRNGRWESA